MAKYVAIFEAFYQLIIILIGKNALRGTNSLLFLLLIKQRFHGFTADLPNLSSVFFTPSLNVIQKNVCA